MAARQVREMKSQDFGSTEIAKALGISEHLPGAGSRSVVSLAAPGLWNELPYLRDGLACQRKSFTVAPSAGKTLKGSAGRLRLSTTSVPLTTKYAASWLATGLTCCPSFRQKTNERARRSIRLWRRTGSRISGGSETRDYFLTD